MWGAALVTSQAVEWQITTSLSATSLNYGILLQGFGGIFAVPLIEAYGRQVTNTQISKFTDIYQTASLVLEPVLDSRYGNWLLLCDFIF
jgi:hypothetical protein